MSLAKSATRVGERGELEDSTGPLPVVMEEEEGASLTVSVPMAGSDSSPNAVPGREDRLSESSHSKDQLQRSGKATEDLSDASEKDETSVISDGSEVVKEERQSQSQTDKEIEVEFQRLSLGFKCDLFTLEKRLRLEERSRDLAEENVRKEISSCQGLLQALIPLCDDDSQSIEIVHRLQKNLEILIQSMTRVSSRSEMLGAIHQEHRVGRAVEVMFQHVENLKRMYTKEHTELVELRQTLMQNERSFGSQTDKADFRGKSQSSSQYYKTKTQDLSESEAERLTRRSPCPSSSPGPSASDALVSQSLSHSVLSHPKGVGGPSGGVRGGRGLWLWLAMVVVLAGLLALLACLVMQPAVDAAPVGTGDSWMTIQQLLWPYTGLRHNGQPPV